MLDKKELTKVIQMLKNLSEDNRYKARKVLDIIEEKTGKEYIQITATVTGTMDIIQSKFGGIPYIPKNYSIPVTQEGNHLTFLAQINCSELPENDIYPKKGILQFWIYGDDLFGADYDDYFQNETKRVIYYENIEKEHLLKDDFEAQYQPFRFDDDCNPIKENLQFSLSFKKGINFLNASSFEYFNDMFTDIWNQMFVSEKIESVYDFEDKVEDYIGKYNVVENKHQIGGHPSFSQKDFRDDEELLKYTELLLQIDSQDNENFESEILWGDCGIGQFFITKEQLKKRDFSKIVYDAAGS